MKNNDKKRNKSKERDPEDEDDFEEETLYEIKIITLGEGGVGKTSMINRFTENKFSLNYLCTIGLDYKKKKFKLDPSTTVNLKIFDTAGQERFRTISVNYVRNTDGVVLVYSITDQESFNSVEKWMETILNYKEGMPIILVGNKSDLKLDRKIDEKFGKEKAEKFGINFYEASCLNGENVKECFNDLVGQIVKIKKEKGLEKKIKKNKNSEENGSFKINNKRKEKSDKCCK